METLAPNEFSYYITNKENKLFVKFFKPISINNEITTALLIVHWMDKRGFEGNSIYNKISTYFALEKGIPVFIFDIQGTGKSKGIFEYPQKQKEQIKTVYEHINQKLQEDFNTSITWSIIPLVHSISAVALMNAINNGLPIKRLIWIGGPPSHYKSLKREVSKEGRFTWLKFRTMAFLDNFTGIIGFPLTFKIFGFKLRLKDIQKSFSKANGAKMMLPHTELDILAVFGSVDQYMNESDIQEEFPKEKSKHINIKIIEGADHGFENRVEELIEVITEFIY